MDGLEGDEDNWLTGPENKVNKKMIDFNTGRKKHSKTLKIVFTTARKISSFNKNRKNALALNQNRRNKDY